MPALRSITARSLRHLDRIDIDLTPEDGEDRRHLVIVGANGSGKSSLCEALAEELDAALAGRAHPAKRIDLREAEPEVLEREERMAHLGRPVRLGWSREERTLPDDFAAGLVIAVYLPARRDVAFVAPPQKLDTDPKRAGQRVADRLLAVLASRQAEARMARESRDDLRANMHEAWLRRAQSALRLVLAEPRLEVVFADHTPMLDLPDGRRLAFGDLSRGHLAAIGIWAEVMTRVEAARARADRPTLEPAGVVIIDAPEADLDPRAQRELLPALLELYPRMQLVVATHSPLVALGLEHALVYDLSRREGREGREVRRAGLEALLAHMIGFPSATADRATAPAALAADARSNDARSNDARSNDARSNDARSNDARSNDASSNDASSNVARANPAGATTRPNDASPKDTIRELPPVPLRKPPARLGKSLGGSVGASIAKPPSERPAFMAPATKIVPPRPATKSAPPRPMAKSAPPRPMKSVPPPPPKSIPSRPPTRSAPPPPIPRPASVRPAAIPSRASTRPPPPGTLPPPRGALPPKQDGARRRVTIEGTGPWNDDEKS